MVRSGNLFADLPAQSEAELTTILAEEPGARVERIVSTGQASPAGFWYDQDGTEWVILLQGAARLLIEGEEAPRTLQPGDFVENSRARPPPRRMDRYEPADCLARRALAQLRGETLPASASVAEGHGSIDRQPIRSRRARVWDGRVE